ncbi:MAG: hypothetical protein M1114_02050 [Candidatus Dependentiae bacterium]|nr:hypothetical protein [Candidatus Dependentiae bacterium]
MIIGKISGTWLLISISLSCYAMDQSGGALQKFTETVNTKKVWQATTEFDELMIGYYKDYIDPDPDRLHEIDETKTVDRVTTRYAAYAEQNRSKAVELLTTGFLDWGINPYHHRINVSFLRLLRLLSNQELEEYLETALKPKHLPLFVEAMCESGPDDDSFKGTTLDRDALIQKVLRADLLDTSNIYALKALFEKNGNDAFYEKHQDAIIAALPQFMKQAPHYYKGIIPMSDQTKLPRLKEEAERVLQNNNYYRQHFADQRVHRSIDEATTSTAKQKEHNTFDRHASFAEQINFLGRELATAESYAAANRHFSAALSDAINPYFIRYTICLRALLEHAQTAFLKPSDVYDTKRILRDLHEKHGIGTPLPDSIAKIIGGIKTFAYIDLSSFDSDKKRKNRVVLNRDLINPYIDKTLMYGFTRNFQGNVLWAVNQTDLEAAWEVPITGQNAKLTVHNNTLYCVDNDSLLCFDKKTGVLNKTLTLPDKSPIVFLGSTDGDILYLVHDNKKLDLLDVEEGSCKTVELTVGDGAKQYFTVDRMFGYYYAPDATITLLKETREGINHHTIKTCDDKEKMPFFESKLAAHDGTIFFERYEKNGHNLVIYTPAPGGKVLDIPLPSPLSTHPCISADGTKIFVITTQGTIIAFSSDYRSEIKKLWSTNMPNPPDYTGLYNLELAVSPSGRTLYVLDKNHSILHEMKTEDGTLIASDACKEGNARYLIGATSAGDAVIRTSLV